MREHAMLTAIRSALAVSGARLRDIVAGASGLSAYEQYLAHLREHHPDVMPLSRRAFFRAEQTARWEGIRRCC